MLKDALLYRQHQDANGYSHLQLIVPKVSRDDVLHKVHNAPSGGHLACVFLCVCVCVQVSLRKYVLVFLCVVHTCVF